MKITDSQVAALRTYLSGGRAAGTSSPGFRELAAASFWEAAQARFADDLTSGPAAFAERVRSRSERLAQAVDPDVARRLILAACADEDISDVPSEIVNQHIDILLPALISEEITGPAELEDILTRARVSADQLLAARAGKGKRTRIIAAGVSAAVIIVAAILLTAVHGISGGPPAAPANFIAAVNKPPAEAMPQSGDQWRYLGKAAGLFAGPHFSWQFGLVQVTGTTPVTGYTAPGHTGETMKAAPGHQFIVIYADPDGGVPHFGQGPGEENEPHAVVVVGGTARAVPDITVNAAEGLLVSVPVGQDALLRVTDEGRTQSFDLRAGRRGPDAIADYYRPSNVNWPSGAPGYKSTGKCPDFLYDGVLDVPCSLDLDISFLSSQSPSLSDWTPGQGWARPGRTWLVIPGMQYSEEPSTISSGSAFDSSFELENSRSFSVQLPDGRIINCATGSEDENNLVSLAFSVPSGFTRGTLIIHADGDLVVNGQADHWSKPPAAKRIQLRTSAS